MAVNSRNDFYRNLAKGLGVMFPYWTRGGAATTAPASGPTGSGSFSAQLTLNQATQSQPGTLTSILLPAGLSAATMLSLCINNAASSGRKGSYLAYFYKIGTLNLAATGNQFSHDAATFPVTRTQFGVASKPLSLTPLLYVTTATTVTAATFILKNSAPSAGYTNQDGTTVTGAKTFTMPAAATAVDSTYVLRLEDGDSGVRDVTQIDIITAASAGAATIFGAELLCPLGSILGNVNFVADALLGGLHLSDLRPASPTSGSLTSMLGVLRFNNVAANDNSLGYFQGALSA